MKPDPDEVGSKLGQAYEALLDSALFQARQGKLLWHQVLEEARHDVEALRDFTQDELALLKAYLRRDLVDAASYLDETGRAYRDWLGFDLELIEQGLLDKFSAATDQTTLALLQMRQHAASIPYYSGQFTGIGTLLCEQCGAALQFRKPGHIPHCPQCQHNRFHRPLAGS